MKGKTKRKLVISGMAVILIASVPITVILTLDIYYLRNSSMGLGHFPNFYLEEPLLYVIIRFERLLVINNSNYQRLQILDSLILKEAYERAPLAKHNNYLFLYRQEKYFGETPEDIFYLEIVDVGDHENLQLTTELQLPIGYHFFYPNTYVHELVEIDNELYFFMHDQNNNNFLVINCTEMHQPKLLDSYQFPGEARTDFNELHEFYIRDKIIFIPTHNATSSFGITIYNITTLDNFTKVGEWFGDIYLDSFDSIYATQDYLFLKKKDSGVEIFNIQNLTHPTRIGYVTGWADFYFCHKNYVLGFSHNYFDIFDCSITNYSVPIYSSLYPDYAYTWFLSIYLDENKITDNYFYLPFEIPWNSTTLHIWDWSDPHNPSIKAMLRMPRVPMIRELYWTYKKIVVPIIIGDALIASVGIVLLRRLKRKK